MRIGAPAIEIEGTQSIGGMKLPRSLRVAPRTRTRTGRGLIGLALGLSVVAACDPGPEDPDEPEPAAEPRIYGGSLTEDVDLRAVVEVRSYYPDADTLYCSGTLVTEDIVLTAAHCFCEGITAAGCRTEAKVFFSGLGVEDDPATYTDESNPGYLGDVIVHPDYYFYGSTVQNDVAVIQLRTTYPSEDLISMVQPIDVAPSSPSAGQSLEIVGFGYSDDDCIDASGDKRKANIDVLDVAVDRFRVTDSTIHTCGGDSGGPALDSQGRLVGVLSSSIGTGSNKISTYMELDFFRDFFADNACDYEEVPVSMWNACSNPLCPCDLGDGDCDSHSECRDDLICVNDVGASYGLPSAADVCEELATAVPHVEFVGCMGSSPRFVVDWNVDAGVWDTFDVDVRPGAGSWQPYYNGSNTSGPLYWGASNRNDTFRVRACRQGSCGTFNTDTTGSWTCGGGGGGGEPL